MLWWLIAKHLVDFLKDKLELAGQWQVYLGSKGSAKEYPCVEVQWNQETGISVYKPSEGGITLWVDTWVSSEQGSSDDVYQRQYDVQSSILDSLREWSDLLLRELQIVTKVECPSVAIAPEGAVSQSTLGCRIILIIEWRRKRYV